MKKIGLLILLAVCWISCIGNALAEGDPAADNAPASGEKERALSMFQPYLYNELAMDEIPDGELTEDMLISLQDEHAARIFDGLLPWLVEKGYVRDLPRSAYLDDEGLLWIEDICSLWELCVRIDQVPIEEMPTSLIHLSPDCDPAATRKCNYFTLCFLDLAPLFELCPECFPAGWEYSYQFAYEFEGVNRLQIAPLPEAVAENGDPAQKIIAYFDHETDECLSVAVQAEGQDSVIVYQNERFELSGITDSCEYCGDPAENSEAWQNLEPGLWHCRTCGRIKRVEEE